MKFGKLALYTVLYLITIGITLSSIILSPHPLSTPWLGIVRAIIIGFASILLTRYTIYMFLAPWYTLIAARERELLSHFVKDYQPLVSVMIPAWNEEVGLLTTVKTLLKSTYRHMEIVVVNDGSTDGSDALMRRFLERYEREFSGTEHIAIRYHYQPNAGKGSALNTAIALSQGEILLSIDADCIVDARAVEAFVSAFRDPRVMAAVGNVKIGNTRTLIGTIQYLEFLFGFYMKKSDSVMNTIYIIGGAAGAFRREVFHRLGGYSTKNLTEDIELSIRIQEAGMRIVYVPNALVMTEGASTMQGLLKQRLRWKRGRFQTFQEHRSLFFSRDPRHNKLLCWIILPMTLFQEVQLGLEPLFILILYTFSLLSGDFSAFMSGIIIVFMMFGIQAWDARGEQDGWYAAFAPIGWLLFYAVTAVEVYSLVKSIWLMLKKKDLTWQKWTRNGATN